MASPRNKSNALTPDMSKLAPAEEMQYDDNVDVQPAQRTAAVVEPEMPPRSPIEPARPNYVDGKSMRDLRVKRATKVEEAHLAGVVPFTIANFNPVAARVECGIIDYSVPAAYGKLGNQKRLKIGSIERTVAVLTVRDLKGYSRPTQAAAEFGNFNDPEVGYEWNLVQPIQQARRFDFEYNNPTDDMAMGGLLVFKGDWNTLANAAKGAEGGIIHIPETRRAANATLLYFTKPVALIDRLTQILDRQKAYCIRKIQQAREYADDPRPEFQASIDIMHRTWGQFGVDRGWADLNQLSFLLLRNAGPGCERCGASRQSGLALFCKCGHPYDAFAAYMAGHKVDVDLLASLPSEKLDQIKTEAKRRRELAQLIEGETAPI